MPGQVSCDHAMARTVRSARCRIAVTWKDAARSARTCAGTAFRAYEQEPAHLGLPWVSAPRISLSLSERAKMSNIASVAALNDVGTNQHVDAALGYCASRLGCLILRSKGHCVTHLQI